MVTVLVSKSNLDTNDHPSGWFFVFHLTLIYCVKYNIPI